MEQKINEWHEVCTQKDIDDILDTYGGFHDACIVSVNFASGMHVDSANAMHFDEYDTYTLNIVFHSQWSNYALELHFAGLRRLHLVGVQDNYTNEIFDASIKFYDNILPSKYQTPARVIVWADRENFDINDIDSQLTEPADTYVIAHSLKWRLIEK
ncbi:MAG: hypothetical protein K2K13_06820 [Clostridiales bacterium]|nr:hypothetical protein [Clostridiales bacterium]